MFKIIVFVSTLVFQISFCCVTHLYKSSLRSLSLKKNNFGYHSNFFN